MIGVEFRYAWGGRGYRCWFDCSESWTSKKEKENILLKSESEEEETAKRMANEMKKVTSSVMNAVKFATFSEKQKRKAEFDGTTTREEDETKKKKKKMSRLRTVTRTAKTTTRDLGAERHVVAIFVARTQAAAYIMRVQLQTTMIRLLLLCANYNRKRGQKYERFDRDLRAKLYRRYEMNSVHRW